LNATSLKISATERWIETISWGFVALIGIWLLYGQLGALIRRRAEPTAVVHHHPRVHAQAHDPAPGHGGGCGCGSDPGHTHTHAHGPIHEPHVHAADGSCCGHAHMPDPGQLEGTMSWRKAIAIALSVGIRPCTGAILVLIFSLSQGILIAGIFATFAMALSTAITVSILASLAVGSRELATRMAGGGDSRLAGAVATGAALL